MNFDADTLIASMIIGGIGTVSFIYGKRQSRLPQMVVGILLIAYPYFISNVFLMIGIAVALLAALWASIRFLRW